MPLGPGPGFQISVLPFSDIVISDQEIFIDQAGIYMYPYINTPEIYVHLIVPVFARANHFHVLPEKISF